MWEFKGTILTAEELVQRRNKRDLTLPVRGPKSFSPSGSWLETKQLQSILDATKSLLSEERVERENALSQAEWDEHLKVAKVTRIVGNQFEKFGHEDSASVFLFPEEALHLLETNHLQILYGGVSMSIQQAYSALLGARTGCTFLEYMVYTHLLKNGFKVLRHCPNRTITRYERLIGLTLEETSVRKSRRKCNVPGRICAPKSDDKNSKMCNKSVANTRPTDKENQSLLSALRKRKTRGVDRNKTAVRNVFDESDYFETTVDSYFSSGSDIQVVSESSIPRTAGRLELDVIEYASSLSSNSDCQVIFSGETKIPRTIQNLSSREKIIEEIDLRDSSESDVDNNAKQDIDDIKSESKEEKLEDNVPKDYFEYNVGCTDTQHFIAESLNDKNTLINTEVSSNSCSLKDNKSSKELNLDTIILENNSRNNPPCVNSSSEMIEESIEDLSDMKEEKVNLMKPEILVDSKKRKNMLKKKSTKRKKKNIEIINIDDESNDFEPLESREKILSSFPDCAGRRIVFIESPSQHWCPPNVNPIHQFYNIDLERLQDPQYGGQPTRKIQENLSLLKNSHYSSNITPRYNYNSNISVYRNLNISQGNEGYNNWPVNPTMPPGEHYFVPEYRPFQAFGMCQSDNIYPLFPGPQNINFNTFQPPRPSRWRGRPNRHRGPYRSNNHKNYYRRSRGRRFPRTRGRGMYSIYPSHYIASYEHTEAHCSELQNDQGDNFFPLSTDNDQNSGCHQRRSEDSSLIQSQNIVTYGGNHHFLEISSKNSRPSSDRNILSFATSENVQLLDGIKPNGKEDLSRSFGNSEGSELRTSNITEVGSRSESSSCSENESNSSSQEFSSDLESECFSGNDEESKVSILLKRGSFQDIDASLKNLDVIRAVKFKGLSVVPDETVLSIKYDIYQPSTPFRRSKPPVPDFRVVIVQPDQNLPTSRQLSFLGENFDDSVPLLFAVTSLDSVAFCLQSVVNLPSMVTR